MNPLHPNKPPQDAVIVPNQEVKKSEVTDKITKASSKLSDFRAKKKSVNVFYASAEELSKSSFKNVMENIKHNLASFFHSPSRTLSFMGFGREIQKDEFLKNIEDKELKIGKSLKDHITKLESELQEVVEDDSGFGIKRYFRASGLKKELEILKREDEKLDKVIANEERGEDVRKQMEVLGGERITIKTPDDVKLDGMYLDAKKFRNTLKEAGGKLRSYEIPVEKGHAKKIEGIAISKEMWETSGKKVVDALEALRGIPTNLNTEDFHPGAGWTAVKDGDDVLLVKSENIPRDTDRNKNSVFEYDKKIQSWVFKTPSEAIKSETTLDETKDGIGTVIITSGNLGIYETSKDEALFYLFKGMNVVMFNFRGYGKSEGVPTKKGLKIDMESAYQLAKAKSGHEDNKILFKALCMSGGPAAYVAGKHPDTNIFLDQSYSSFRNLAKENVKNEIRKYILAVENEEDPNIIRKIAAEFAVVTVGNIINLFVNFVTPDFNTAKYLSKNKGQKGLSFIQNDELIEFKHVEKNLAAVSNAGEMKNTTLFAMQGEHGDSLIFIKSTPLDYASKTNKKEIDVELAQKIIKEKELKEEEVYKLESELIDYKELLLNTKAVINAQERQLKYFEQEINRAQAKIDIFHSELKKIEDEITQLLPADWDSSTISKREKTAQNQMSHFLKKAKLSDDLIH